MRTTFDIAPVGDDDAATDAPTAAPAAGAAAAAASAQQHKALDVWDRSVPLACAVPSWFCEAAPFAMPEWPDYVGRAASRQPARSERTRLVALALTLLLSLAPPFLCTLAPSPLRSPAPQLESGLTPLPVPAAPLWQPLETSRPLREGALHESAATGLLPLACAQPRTDARLARALRSARFAAAPRGGFALGAEGALSSHVWAGLAGPHPPSVRPLPPSAPHPLSQDPATGLTEAGANEADACYLLHPYQASLEPFSAAPPDVPSELTGVRHAHAAGLGLSAPPPRVPGLLNAGLAGGGGGGGGAPAAGARGVHAGAGAHTGGGGSQLSVLSSIPPGGASAASAGASASASAPPSSDDAADAAGGAAFGGASPLDANGALPTQGQIYGAQTGFSSLRAMQVR